MSTKTNGNATKPKPKRRWRNHTCGGCGKRFLGNAYQGHLRWSGCKNKPEPPKAILGKARRPKKGAKRVCACGKMLTARQYGPHRRWCGVARVGAKQAKTRRPAPYKARNFNIQANGAYAALQKRVAELSYRVGEIKKHAAAIAGLV